MEVSEEGAADLLEAGALQELSLKAACHLSRQGERLVPEIFEGLVKGTRPLLLEVCCAPGSVLSATAVQLGHQPEALRCAEWNSGDLTRQEGQALVLQRLRLENPRHLWISPPCSPFSPMQSTNQRTPEQCSELRRKREYAVKIYKGALGIFEAAVRQGSHASLEMSEKCHAWRLPFLQDFIRRMELHTVVVKGCSVNLRDREGRLMSKGWRVVTTCPELAKQLNLPCKCDKGYRHGVCEGESARRSAMYTKELAQRVVRGMSCELGYQATLQECQGETSLPGVFGRDEGCVCGDVLHQQGHGVCASCLLGRDQVEFGGTASETAYAMGEENPSHEQALLSQTTRDQCETQALN